MHNAPNRGNFVVAVSGGFDPVHVGHVKMFEEAKKLGDYLVVILNCDDWLVRKKGYVFMPAIERAAVIRSIRWVDDVYIHESEDQHVAQALEHVRPHVFANGGDRKAQADIPEAEVCGRLGIEMAFNVGGGKIQSSSWLLQKVRQQNVS